ncbi:MAG: ISAzo13 family transposase [Burkholderiales bacterium]
MEDLARIRHRFAKLRAVLDERSRRLVVAAESVAIGRGGISAVSRATGVSRQVIRRGVAELKKPAVGRAGRIRRPGGGRKKTALLDATLQRDLERLVEPVTRGDPESPLRWTCKSVRKLAAELRRQRHPVSHRLVAELLHEVGYSLQANRKTQEGAGHPDRNAQFEYLNRKVKRFLASGQPVISVDTKKRELVGNFKNGGRELRPKGDPEKVRVHDFVIPEVGRATPYGIYDIARNTGWVSVGVDHDTAVFAVESIRRWWRSMGQAAYPQATRLLITADGGGSNGARLRLWKLELQKLADETGLRIVVSHFPPGTSKWNKIEHRLFSFISQNWRGKPLISHEVIVNLIANTTTETGLQVHSELDTRAYPAGIRVSDQDLAEIDLRRDRFHGDWNYTINPRRQW